MNRKIIKKVFGKKMINDINDGLCPTCRKPVGEFRDELSKKEFKISGMCQQCQDEVFEESKMTETVINALMAAITISIAIHIIVTGGRR